jgi:hypothetical protein
MAQTSTKQKMEKNAKIVQLVKVIVLFLIKACLGTGKVTGKKACMNCDTRGFIHTSVEREHDVPQNLRCFFCKDCPICKGSGLEAIPRKAPNLTAIIPIANPAISPPLTAPVLNQ